MNPTAASTVTGKPVRATVIVVSYNSPDKLLACLGSVTGSLPADCELLVIDNASPENNADAVAAAFPSVRLLRSPENLGFAGGANEAVKASRGEFIVLLNPDTTVREGWLDQLIAPLVASDHIGMTTSRILLAARPQLFNASGCEIHLSGISLCRGLGRNHREFDPPRNVAAVSGAAFAIRREVFDLLGGLDSDMFLYLEDIDLSMRARLAGFGIEYAPGSVVLHDYELRITPLKVFWQERNRYQMLLKNLSWPTLLVLLPTLFLAEVITWGFVVLKDRKNITNKLNAYRWVFENWGKIMSKRRQVQSLRRAYDRDILLSTSYRLEFEQAATGALPIATGAILNPIFFLLRAIALALVWW
ncbi:MAG TPA: glycosyltransferase family 2 protein [Blastocatellia bacterium]|nr:glycosyltransferase family 2 protein [Blastocatellia bacterium]